jgi:hypothetical protein
VLCEPLFQVGSDANIVLVKKISALQQIDIAHSEQPVPLSLVSEFGYGRTCGQTMDMFPDGNMRLMLLPNSHASSLRFRRRYRPFSATMSPEVSHSALERVYKSGAGHIGTHRQSGLR